MLVVFAVLSRLVGPEGFGLISLATALAAILMAFVDSGFSKALIQLKTLGQKDAATAFWTAMAMAVLLYVVLFFTAPLIANAFNEPDLALVLQILCLTLPITALSRTPAALLERDFDFKSLSIRQFIGTIAGAAIAIPLALVGAGVWALVAQTLATAVASLVALWAATTWRPTFEFSFASLKKLFAIGISILGIDLLDAVQANIDKILIGAFFSAEQLGYYFLAQRVGTILVELVTSVISRVSLTTFSRVQDDLPRLNRVLRQLTFAAAAIGVPIFGLVALFAPQIVPFIFGDGWEPAIPLLWIMAPSWAISAVMYFDRSVFLATGHAGTALWVALLQNVVGIVLVFAAVPFGTAGVAFSRWSRILTWPIRLALLRKFIQIKVWPYLGQVFRCILAMLPVVAGIALLQQTDWAASASAFWLFAVPMGIVSFLVYAGLIWLLAGSENRTVLRRTAGDMTARFRRS